ncbi:putative RNA-directed DNA polymerase, eukaryota, reverse transcriptase zinc-binding domain protein, partial [Tanacetum coccineum]
MQESAKATDLRNTLNIIDIKAETSPLTQVDIDSRTFVVKELFDLECRKIKDLWQKAKIKWALEGDENSKNFHGVINNRVNKSRINVHSRSKFTSTLFKRLSFDDNTFLDNSFTNQEIKDVVWDCGSEKALGSDGFTFKLFKRFWDILEKDIISYVKGFESTSLIPRGWNSLFFTLIAKIDDPIFISDFRPISLIGETQMAFIKVRQIIDGPLMINEIISWEKKERKRLLLFKVDIEKAFDSLNWNFLISVMSQMGFSLKWINWIISCLNSSYASVLINGIPTKEFKLERGLRQGDPLSPFLFILVVEALNVVMLEAKNKNIFKGIEVGNDKVYMSHLQFADDALIMGEWSLHNVKNLTPLPTPLVVNLHYSPCIYLGLPIGANMSRCESWSPIVDRFHKRLSMWKAKSLSFGGRLTLIKFVLGSLGVYYFSTFKAPIGTINKLESIRRKFFWGDNMEENKIAWIAWDKVIAPLKNRGLGIGSLLSCNQAMLSKWKIKNGQDTHFWLDTWIGNKPLKDSFPRLFALCPIDANFRHDTTSNLLHHNSTGNSHLLGPYEFGPNGSRNNNFVQTPMLPRGLQFQWSWYRTPRSPNELQELNGLVELVTHLHLTNDSDKWTCFVSDSKDFLVKAMRIHISKTTSLLPAVPYRWNNILPSKVNISSWRILHRRLPTRLNLDKCGIDLDSVLCPVCHDSLESEDYIFIHCCIVKSTWLE